jgi:hypothetical protein
MGGSGYGLPALVRLAVEWAAAIARPEEVAPVVEVTGTSLAAALPPEWIPALPDLLPGT